MSTLWGKSYLLKKYATIPGEAGIVAYKVELILICYAAQHLSPFMLYSHSLNVVINITLSTFNVL